MKFTRNRSKLKEIITSITMVVWGVHNHHSQGDHQHHHPKKKGVTASGDSPVQDNRVPAVSPPTSIIYDSGSSISFKNIPSGWVCAISLEVDYLPFFLETVELDSKGGDILKRNA